jgi:hypothetical protein
MRLLVSGCSYSAGASVTHVRDGKTYEDLICEKKDAGFLWPNLISEANGYELHNISLPGNSNDKIIRQTIEWLEKNGTEDTIAVIQFSSLYRHEFYNEVMKEHINYCTSGHLVYETAEGASLSNNSVLYDAHSDNSKIHDKLDDSKMHQKTLLALSDMLKYTWNKDNLQIAYLQKVIFLQNYLKDAGVPYLFTSMSIGSNVPQMVTNVTGFSVEYTRLLKNLVDLHHWAQPLSAASLDNTFEDGHPNEEGNNQIAKYIQDQLNRILSKRQ